MRCCAQTGCSWTPSQTVPITHCGVDNKPGDIIVSLPSRPGEAPASEDSSFTIAIEAKNVTRAMGRRKVANEIGKCVDERGADAGILVARDASSLGKELGDWDEGLTSSGVPWIATTKEHAVTVRSCFSILPFC